MPHDISVPVRVKNTGNSERVLRWDGGRYRIPPGAESIVPYGAMARWAGDPNATDTGPGSARRSEVARLTILHGVGVPDPGKEDSDPGMPNDNPLGQVENDLEFSTLDGDRITTILDDPEGDHLKPSTQTEQENRFLQDQVTSLSRQLQQMQATLDMRTRMTMAEDMGDADDDEAPEPFIDPSSPPPSRSRPGPVERAQDLIDKDPDQGVEASNKKVPDDDVTKDNPDVIRVGNRQPPGAKPSDK